MGKPKSVVLNCFSPPVMVATMLIEVSLAVYTLWRYKLNELTRLIALTLTMLATFQLAEFLVCTGYVGNTEAWSRFGFVAITFLPPLGVHIAHVLAGKTGRKIVYTAYATMAGFIAYFLLAPDVFNNHQCTGNYVIFHLRAHAGGYYWLYYFGWIFTGIGLGLKWLNDLKNSDQKVQISTIQALIVGWLVFVVPTGIANVINPETRAGIPSVMCGFAVLYALILGLYILPKAAKLKRG